MTAIERARAIAARAKGMDPLKSYYWTIARPGEEPFWIHVNPPQDAEWIAQHYQGAHIIKGKQSC